MREIGHILTNYQDYQEIILISSRGEGKTWMTAHWILPQIKKGSKKFLWLRRYNDDARQSLLDYFKLRVDEYCEWNKVPVKEQERIWEVIVRGTFHKKDNSIIFVELQHYNRVRGAFSENPALIVFDEAIPTLLGSESNYLINEADKFIDFWKSAWRERKKPKPTILHLSNPYDRTFHRLKDWDKEIDIIAEQELYRQGDKEDWYWEQEKMVLDEDTKEMVKKKLIFYRKAGDFEDWHRSWPKLFIKKGNLNVREIPNNSLIPIEIYNNKFLLSRTRRGSILYMDFIPEEINRKKLMDYHLSEETFFLDPASRWKELLTRKTANLTKKEWTDWINKRILFFSNFEVRKEVIDLLS